MQVKGLSYLPTLCHLNVQRSNKLQRGKFSVRHEAAIRGARGCHHLLNGTIAGYRRGSQMKITTIELIGLNLFLRINCNSGSRNIHRCPSKLITNQRVTANPAEIFLSFRPLRVRIPLQETGDRPGSNRSGLCHPLDYRDGIGTRQRAATPGRTLTDSVQNSGPVFFTTGTEILILYPRGRRRIMVPCRNHLKVQVD